MGDLFILQLTNRPVGEKYKMNMVIPEFKNLGKKRFWP